MDDAKRRLLAWLGVMCDLKEIQGQDMPAAADKTVNDILDKALKFAVMSLEEIRYGAAGESAESTPEAKGEDMQ